MAEKEAREQEDLVVGVRPDRERVRASVHWMALAAIGKVVASFGSVVVLAHLLGPGDFGEVGVAILAINVALLVGEGPMIASVVQAPILGRAELEFANAVQLVVGLVGASALVIGGGAIADLFGQPGAAKFVRFGSLIVLLVALNAPARGLILRRLDFRLNAVAEILPAVGGLLCVAPALAVAGFGPWSLMIGYFVVEVLTVAVAVAAARPPWRLRRRAPEHRQLLGFSRRIAWIGMLNYSLENIDNVMVSRWFGAASFGAYSCFFGSLRTMSDTYLRAISGAMFPVLSRSNASDEANGARTERAVEIVALSALVTLPAFVTLAFIGPTAVRAVFGPKWSQYGDILPGIAIAVSMFVAPVGIGPLLWARAKLRLDLVVQIASLAAVVVALLLLRNSSMVVVTWGIAGAYFLRAMCTFAAGASVVGVRLLRMAGVWLVWAPVAVAVGLGAHAVDRLLETQLQLAAAPRLCLSVLAAALLWFAMVRAFARRLLPATTYDLVYYLPVAARHACRLLLGSGATSTHP